MTFDVWMSPLQVLSGENEQLLRSIWDLSGESNKASRWQWPLHMQETINPHFLLPRWILFGPVSSSRENKDKQKIERGAAGLSCHI